MSTISLRSRRPTRGTDTAKPPPVTATGVEVDGTSIRVVEVRSGRVTSYHQYVGETVTDALETWRPRRRIRNLRVSWASGMQAARTNIPNVPAVIRPLAIADAAEALFPAEGGSLMTAGVAAEAPATAETTSATMVAVRREKVSPVSKALRKRAGFDLLPAPLTLVTDGLYLTLGDQAASVALIDGGVPVAYREMTGTPPIWEASMSENDANSYLSALIPEVSATLASWQSRGHQVPDGCFTLGPGSACGPLPRALASIGLVSDPLPTPDGITCYDIPASEVSSAYLAVAAAAAPNAASIRMIDALAMAEARASARSRRKLTVAVGSVASAAILAAAGVVPLVLAGRALDRAARAERTARAQALSVARWTDLARRVDGYSADVRAAAAADPHYARGLGMLLSAAPAGTSYTSISTQTSASGLAVTLSASVPGANFDPIASWVSRLEAAGATNVQAQSFAASHGTSTLSLTLDVPASSAKQKG